MRPTALGLITLFFSLSSLTSHSLAHEIQIQTATQTYSFTASDLFNEDQIAALKRDLLQLSQIKVRDSALAQTFFTIVPESYLAWLSSKVTKFDYLDNIPGKKGLTTRAVYNDAPNLRYKKHLCEMGSVILTKNFFSSPPFSRLGTLVHEAKHADGEIAYHVRCKLKKSPFLDAVYKNSYGCDANIYGSYAFKFNFYLDLAVMVPDAFGIFQIYHDILEISLRDAGTRILDVSARALLKKEAQLLFPKAIDFLYQFGRCNLPIII